MKNRKFINEENKLKYFLQVRKKEEVEQLKEKAEQQRKSRITIKDVYNLNNDKKNGNRSLNRINTSKSPIRNLNYDENYCPDKEYRKMINSKSSSRILENSLEKNRSFSINNSRLFEMKNSFKNNNLKENKNFFINKNDNLNNTISVINNNSKNILNSKSIFNEEASLNTKDSISAEQNNIENQNNYYNINKALDNSKINKNTIESHKGRKKNLRNNNQETISIQNNFYKINEKKSDLDLIKIAKKNDVKEPKNSDISLVNNHKKKRVKNISYDANANQNRININDLNDISVDNKKSINFLNENNENIDKRNNIKSINKKTPNVIQNSTIAKNNFNQSFDSKRISQNKNNNNYNKSNYENKVCEINPKIKNNFIQEKYKIINDNQNQDNLKQNFNNEEQKESLNYRLYNEIKNMKKFLDSENNEKFKKEDETNTIRKKIKPNQANQTNYDHVNNLSRSKSTERIKNKSKNCKFVYDNIQSNLNKEEFNNLFEPNKSLNSSVAINLNNNKPVKNIYDNSNKINNKIKDKADLKGNQNINCINNNQSNNLNNENDEELEKEILDNYKNSMKKRLNENNYSLKSGDKYSDFKNDAYTLGPVENFIIEDKNINNYDEFKNNHNTNTYIKNISENNIYKRDLVIAKPIDSKEHKKVKSLNLAK